MFFRHKWPLKPDMLQKIKRFACISLSYLFKVLNLWYRVRPSVFNSIAINSGKNLASKLCLLIFRTAHVIERLIKALKMATRQALKNSMYCHSKSYSSIGITKPLEIIVNRAVSCPLADLSFRLPVLFQNDGSSSIIISHHLSQPI